MRIGLSLRTGLSLLLVAALLAVAASYPSELSCSNSLAVGTSIMGAPIRTASSAPASEQHQFTVEKDGAALACDGSASVTPGDELVVKITGTLQSDVAMGTWNQIAGPNYVVEVTQATGLVLASGARAGSTLSACPDSAGSNNRIINAGVDITVVAVAAGELKIRLASAYAYGPVALSDECTLTVTAASSVSTISGFLVCKTMDNQLIKPYEHSLADLRACQGSGFAIIQETSEGSGTWAVEKELDAAGNEEARAQLQKLVDDNAGTAMYADNKKDMQYTIVGIVSGTTISVIDMAPCVKGVCTGYYNSAAPPPADAICYDSDGLCLESSSVDNGILTLVVTSDDDAWFGVGVTTSSGGMTGNGGGADMFICSEEGLRRYWVTKKENPAGQGVVNWEGADQGSCEFVDGKGTMTIKRTLTASGQEREIVAGTPQDFIWARGPSGSKALGASSAHRSRGFESLDLTNLAGGSSTVKIKGQWTLWLHLIFMAFAWGMVLPLGAAIPKFCKDVKGAPPRAWFKLHKACQRLGWTLQLLGLIFAVCHCEKYSVHFNEPHTVIGIIVVVIGTLQPVVALLRPHPPPGGWGPSAPKPASRIGFEVWHKGLGWGAVLLGMANVIIGSVLAKDQGYYTATYAVPLAIGCTGITAFLLYVGLGLSNADNGINRALTGAKNTGQYEMGQKIDP